jgi:integrase
MHEESSHGSASRERVAENVYSRRTKRGGVVFETTFRDVDGQQRTRKLAATGERAAIKEARSILAGRDGGGRVVAAGITLGELADRDYFPMLDSLVGKTRSERGVELYRDRYRIHLEPRLGDVRLGDVDARDVAAIITGMRAAGYAESTIHSTLVVLRGLFRLATRRGLVARSPLDGLDPAELPRAIAGNHGRRLDEVELATLVRHAPALYRSVVTVLAFTGLRLSEALGLRWQDVDLVEGELHVRGQLTLARGERRARFVAQAKTAASLRIVPLMPAVERALVDQLALEQAAGRGGDDELVFQTRRGTPLGQANVRNRGVVAAAKAAGLRHVTPQDLRRSFCSLSGRRGVDPVEAAQITGHSLEVWARSYAGSFGKAQRDEALARLLAHGLGAVDEPVADVDARDA